MPVEIERIAKIEDGLRATQDNVLLIHNDLKQIGVAISDMAHGVKKLTDIQSDLRVMDERYESRYIQLREANKVIQHRVDDTVKSVGIINNKAQNGNRAYEVLMFIAKTLGYSALTLIFGLTIYVIQLKG